MSTAPKAARPCCVALLALLVVLLGWLVPSGDARAQGVEQARREYLADLRLLKSVSGSEAAQRFEELAQRVRGLTAEEMAYLKSALGPSWELTMERLRQLRPVRLGELKRQLAEKAASAPATMALAVLDPLPPVEFHSRCPYPGVDTEVAWGLLTAADAAALAAIAAQAACDTIVVILGEGTNAPACITAGILNAASQAAQLAYNQFDFCGGDIDSRFIEATYDAVVKIYEVLDRILDLVQKQWAMQVEEQMHLCRRLVTLRLTEAQGGHLETVQTLMRTWLDRAVDAGLLSPGHQRQAERAYAEALAHIAGGEPGKGFKSFCKAYNNIANTLHD